MSFIMYILTALIGSAVAAGILTLFVGILKRTHSKRDNPHPSGEEYKPEPAGFAASIRR